MDVRPIGVYDSGMGGISIWRAIKQLLPNESIVYLGDGKNCPYGDKSPEQVQEFAFAAAQRLLDHNCKMIVVACNTATSMAISKLRYTYPDTPFVGMEPAIKPACIETKSGVVAVLATKRSLESELFADTLSKYASDVEVIKQVGEGFVELVEAGVEDGAEAYSLVKSIVDDMASKGVDKIVLGCTHYPFLNAQFTKAIAGRNIDLIDPSAAIIRRIKRLLDQFNIEAPENNVLREDKFITFGDESYRKKLIKRAESSLA